MSDTQVKRSGFIGATIGNAWGGLRDAVSGVKPTRSRMMEYDQPLLWVAIVLLTLGLVMVYSASIALPDMGAFLVIAAVAMGILFLGGINGKLFAGLVGVAIGAFALLITASPWRRERIFAYLSPWEESNALGKAYQLTHSLIAFGRGEWTGVGLGGSIEKLHYLPEAHTDFLLAVMAEELGFAGVALVIGLFAWIVARAFAIARQAAARERHFAALASQGIGVWIGWQTFINMGVNLGLLPTKGLTLPLVSYGGSGILMNCIGLAIVLRIDYENRVLMRGGKV